MPSTQLRAALSRARTAAIFLPAALIATDATAGSLALAWDAGATGTVGYIVHCGQASRSYSSHIDAGSATTVQVSGLLDGLTYFCAVTAYDAARMESSYSNEVSATIPYGAPAVAFNASPTSGTAPLSVSFSNSTTGQVTSWSWDFGDGGYSSEAAPTHVYSTPGDYWVTLTAIGPGGTATKTLGTAISAKQPTTSPSNGKGKGKGKK